ncbi:META domain-containing protein [Phaeocystidibacter marisrubri]|uniref:META domain-containing protein n=1 Tax=Phaeocystidibacter marisrubri TaxID=1577780 RepID=A0A6L3ZDW3_9FLAO|nr:META domain-containing protein [Phaeocystidibacter marisrubri]KAB2815860.1 META domain-containing protein [Phaeocystidibacter marisrubri]
MKLMTTLLPIFSLLLNTDLPTVHSQLMETDSIRASTDSSQLAGIKWDLMELITPDGESVTDFHRSSPYVVFSKNGKLSGYTTCNSFLVSYLTDENQKLTVYRDFEMTTFACLDDELDKALVYAIRSSSSFKISDNELHLMAGDVLVLKFMKS